MTLHLGTVLVTRAWPRQDVVDGFDQWQTATHLPDLAALSGVEAVSYYATQTSGLPQAWQGSGNRMAAYWATNLQELERWLADPGLAEAIQDGSRFFSGFNELDGSTYTGNVYTLGPRWPGDPEPSLAADMVIERFEVPAALEAEFDQWVIHTHLPSLRSVPGVRWAQWGKAVRGLSVSYYNSPGNRILLAEFDQDQEAFVRDPAIDRLVADSQKWDRQLGYVRRELNTALGTVLQGKVVVL